MKAETQHVTWADGTTETVVTDMRDWAAFDLARAARKWPPMTDAPMLHRAFIIHNARRRTSPDLGKFDFDTHCPTVIDIKPEEEDTGDPQ